MFWDSDEVKKLRENLARHHNRCAYWEKNLLISQQKLSKVIEQTPTGNSEFYIQNLREHVEFLQETLKQNYAWLKESHEELQKTLGG